MLHKVKETVKNITPHTLMLTYHRVLSALAAWWYNYPSRKMLVIGVTGTNGKSTTCHLIARVLEATGFKVGVATTVEFQVGQRRWLNDTKMTMLGRFQLQRLLREMVDEGVKYAVIEVSSQGMEQHRAAEIDFDIAVFTNLTPEHIEAHGSFNAYKEAKGKLFASLSSSRKKYSIPKNGDEEVYADEGYDDASVNEKIYKTIIANGDDDHAAYFLSFDAEEKYCYGIDHEDKEGSDHSDVRATKVTCGSKGSSFSIGSTAFNISLPGRYNVFNALAAITVGLTRGMGFGQIAHVLSQPISVPGRFERIDEGQKFEVIVDYAPEPASLAAVYGVIDAMPKKRLIHVLGSCGGGRDVSRRPIMGSMAAQHAQIVIITNEDPYDDDPQTIINDVAEGSRKKGKEDGKNLLTILDRAKAIETAIMMAQDGDVVLITGKGAEQAMCVANGKKIPWDDRTHARNALNLKKYHDQTEGG